MADLQEQLQAILGDPEAMEQITAIAQALTTPSSTQTPQAQPHDEPQPKSQDIEFVPVEPSTTQNAPSPDISSLLSLFGNGTLPQIDPKLISTVMRLFSESSASDDERIALISALKPYLKEERWEKIEKAQQIARFSKIARVALRLLREESDYV